MSHNILVFIAHDILYVREKLSMEKLDIFYADVALPIVASLSTEKSKIKLDFRRRRAYWMRVIPRDNTMPSNSREKNGHGKVEILFSKKEKNVASKNKYISKKSFTNVSLCLITNKEK